MVRRNLYAFDCGTTNWRIQWVSYEETVGHDGTRQRRALSDPQRVALATFSGHHLPAALLLKKNGQVQSYGKNSYEQAGDVRLRPYLRDGFKLCIGNDKQERAHHKRYSHQEALTYTELLLKKVLERLRREKPRCFEDETLFFFAHPVHWGHSEANGVIKGAILTDFATIVRRNFPPQAQKNIHFVPEPEGALVSLFQSGQLKVSPNKWTLVVDVGGGTTDFVAGQLTTQGLHSMRHYGGAIGGGLFDDDLALYLADVLKVPEEKREGSWSQLRQSGCDLKESLNRQIIIDPTKPVTKTIMQELPAEKDEAHFLRETVEFDKAQFEAQTEQTRASFKQLVLRALFEMDLRRSDVEQIVLVGGGANLYLVPQLLNTLFRGTVPLLYASPPEETIVRGTALWWLQQGLMRPSRSYGDKRERDKRLSHFRQRLVALRKRQVAVLKRLSMNDAIATMHELTERLTSDTFKILVMGETNIGKSTLINALLGAEPLPTSMVPCTAMVTEVKWGDKPRALLHVNSKATSSTKEIPTAELEQIVRINDFSNRKEANERSNEYVELFYPYDFCRQRVELIDTPAFYQSQSPLILPTADLILFVLPCDRLGPAISEREMIDHLHTCGHEEIYFICNRFDLIRAAERERVRQHGIHQLSGLTKLGRDGIFFVSALDALEGHLDQDESLLQQSALPQLDLALKILLAEEREKVKILRVARGLKRSIDEAKRVLSSKEVLSQKELEATKKKYTLPQSPPELKHLQKQLSEIETSLNNLIGEISAYFS